MDLGSAFEKAGVIYDIMQMIVPPAYEMFECEEIITKVPVYAVERTDAAKRFGFEKAERLLV